jgi:hypothetical protein
MGPSKFYTNWIKQLKSSPPKTPTLQIGVVYKGHTEDKISILGILISYDDELAILRSMDGNSYNVITSTLKSAQ